MLWFNNGKDIYKEMDNKNLWILAILVLYCIICKKDEGI